MSIFNKLVPKRYLLRLQAWARKSGADLSISSSANPETTKRAVIISARNVHFSHPLVGHTFMCAQGDNSEEAARRFLEKLEQYEYSIDRGQDVNL